jgi:hypothetical protein
VTTQGETGETEFTGLAVGSVALNSGRPIPGRESSGEEAFTIKSTSLNGFMAPASSASLETRPFRRIRTPVVWACSDQAETLTEKR